MKFKLCAVGYWIMRTIQLIFYTLAIVVILAALLALAADSYSNHGWMAFLIPFAYVGGIVSFIVILVAWSEVQEHFRQCKDRV